MTKFVFFLLLSVFPDAFEHAISARSETRARVFAAPDPKAPVVGIVEAGHGFPIFDVHTQRRCPGGFFLQIAADHYVCSANFSPSAGFPVRQAAAAPDPFAGGAAWRWRRTTDTVGVFHAAASPVQKLFELPADSLVLFRRNFVRMGGAWMLVTTRGWALPAGALEPVPVSRFAGRRIQSEEDALWAVAAGDRYVKVQNAPPHALRRLPHLSWVRLKPVSGATLPSCLELENGGCIDARFLYLMESAQPPPGIGDNEKWVDVNIASQTLVAYEGRRPVFFTVVSTGRPGADTHPGNYNIHYKRAVQDLQKKENNTFVYYYESIPYVQFYRGVFAFHPSPWHDAYGSPHSRGCVEMSLADAAFLYGWTLPMVPDGYLAIAASPTRPGTKVRIVDVPRRPRLLAHLEKN